MWSLWQDWCSVTFSDLRSHHCEGSKKNSRTGSLSDPQELRNKSCTFDHIKANSMRSCILHRLCPIIRFASEDITLIRSRIFGKQKREENPKSTQMQIPLEHPKWTQIQFLSSIRAFNLSPTTTCAFPSRAIPDWSSSWEFTRLRLPENPPEVRHPKILKAGAAGICWH
jgi:hypothetical protein